MKLRKKETGEIIDIKDALRSSDDYPNHYLISGDWEDVPEKPQGIKSVGNIGSSVHIEVGTKEEAEKTVEKLKAWQRLKDKGFRTYDICKSPTGFVIHFEVDWEHRGVMEDLDLLFGGEK